MSDRFSPGRVAAFAQGMICVALLFIFFFAHISWLAVGVDVFVYSRPVCSFESTAGVADSLFKRRGDVGCG